MSYTPPPPSDSTPPPYGAPPPPPPGPTPLVLPQGVELASHGRRIGAYFLAIPLVLVTLGIGYLIWGAIVWSKGTSPALQVLGMKVWHEPDQRVARWGDMALRNIVGNLLYSFCFIISIVSFVMFLSDDRRRSLHDRIASTTVVHDPNKVLG